jgi:glycosyltransferase involved in cell wall biosynthesis
MHARHILIYLVFLFSGLAASDSINAELPIVVVTASYKNVDWYKWNLDSVFDQEYENWRLIYIDDCSPDGTGELVKEYVKKRGFEDKVTVICNSHRRKALANLYTGIHMCAPDDIVVLLDGDDRLASHTVLQEVNDIYTENDVWLTYGQFKTYPEGYIGFCCPMPADIIANNAFRECSVSPSHLRTFYAGLFHKIKREDLMYEGDFFPITYDLAIMYPMLEMACDHFMFCPKVLYEYNIANPINDYKVSWNLQRECESVIRSLDRYNKIESPF